MPQGHQFLRRAVAVNAEVQHLDFASGHSGASGERASDYRAEGFIFRNLLAFGKGIAEHRDADRVRRFGERCFGSAKTLVVDADVGVALPGVPSRSTGP